MSSRFSKPTGRRPTPALVISVIGLIAAIGGGTFAIAASDNAKDKKIAKKVVKKLARTLSVANAKHANSADAASTAGSANTANSVGGVTLVPISYHASVNSAAQQVFNAGGLSLTASCPSSTESVKANATGTPGALNSYSADTNSGPSLANGVESFPLSSGADKEILPDNFVSQEGHIGFYITGGSVVQIQWQSNNSAGSPPNDSDCNFTGIAEVSG